MGEHSVRALTSLLGAVPTVSPTTVSHTRQRVSKLLGPINDLKELRTLTVRLTKVPKLGNVPRINGGTMLIVYTSRNI